MPQNPGPRTLIVYVCATEQEKGVEEEEVKEEEVKEEEEEEKKEAENTILHTESTTDCNPV